MRKSLVFTLALVCAGALFVACEPGEQEMLPPPPLPDRAFVCPDVLIPLDSIKVTVRAGRFARENGQIKVRSKPGADVDSLFSTPGQKLHFAPNLLDGEDGTVKLRVFAFPGRGPGAGQAAPPPFESLISLDRCTDHEGNLIRIHVDAPERGPGNTGPPSITVTGIYDRLTSKAALEDQAYECKRCNRVEVCGTAPECN